MFKPSFCAVVRQGALFPIAHATWEHFCNSNSDKPQPLNLHVLHHMLSQGSNKCLTLLGLGAFTAADTNRVVCKWNTSSGIASSLRAESHGPGLVSACLGRLTARSVPPEPFTQQGWWNFLLCSDSIAAKMHLAEGDNLQKKPRVRRIECWQP